MRSMDSMTGFGIRLGLMAGLIATLASPVPASGQWLSPQQLVRGGASGSTGRVAMAADGGLVATWSESSGNSTSSAVVSSRAPGGTWEEPLVLASGGRYGRVAANDRGDAVVAWADAQGAWVRSRGAGNGAWGPPELIVAGDAAIQELTMNASGAALISYQLGVGASSVMFTSVRPDLQAGWEPPAQVATAAGGSGFNRFRTAIDDAGNAVAVWDLSPPGPTWASRLIRGGSWSSPVELSSSGETTSLSNLALNGRGAGVATWQIKIGNTATIYARFTTDAGATWGAPETVAPGFGPKPVIDGTGNATIVFSANSPGGNYIGAATRLFAQGSWMPAVRLSTVMTVMQNPIPAVNARGDTAVAWDGSYDASSAYVMYAATRRGAEGAWTPQVQLSPFSALSQTSTVDVAVDAEGDAVASWNRSEQVAGGVVGHAEVAGFDDAPPRLNGLTVPSTGIADVGLRFAVSPLDVWSAIGATTWNFGDGTTAQGASVSHAYSQPGTYSVTVTTRDVLDHEASAAGSVTVAKPQTPGRPTGRRSTSGSSRLKALPGFRPVFATRARRSGGVSGLLVNVGNLGKLPTGTKVTVSCLAACVINKRDRRMNVTKPHGKKRASLVFSHGIRVNGQTRLRLAARRSGYTGRYLTVRFARARLSLVPRRVAGGCLSGSRPVACA